jgi:hypothetical protein
MNLSGLNRVIAGELGEPAHIADQHPRPLHILERAVEGLRDGRLDQAVAQSDPQLAAKHLDDALGRRGVGADQEIAQDRRLARRTRGDLDRRERVGDLDKRRTEIRVGVMAGQRQRIGHGEAQVGRPVVGRGEVRLGDRRGLRDGRRDRGPTDAGRALIGLREGPSGQEDGRDRQLVRIQGPEVLGQQVGLLGRSRGRRKALGKQAPATHGGDGIPCRRWCRKRGSRRS